MKGVNARFLIAAVVLAGTAGGPTRASETEKDHAGRDNQVTLNYCDDVLDRNRNEGENDERRRNHDRDGRAGIREERRGTCAVHQSSGNVETLSEDIGRGKPVIPVDAGCGPSQLAEAVDNRRNPLPTEQQQGVERAEPHDFADQG